MASEQEIVLKDIPADEVDKVAADFQSEGFAVTMARQKDGRWAVRARSPESLSSSSKG